MVEFGFFSLVIAFCLSLYGLIMGSLSIFKPVKGVVLSARAALMLVSFCVFISALVLWTGLLTHDFSIRYVFRNSSVDMPLVYLGTSFWSSLEGSHMLWTLILSTMVTAALATVRPRNESLMPGLLMSFGLVLTFMTLLLIWASSPLTRLFPPGQFGAGMNALLQNPYMAAHPPSLFTGYCSLVVPFAYGMAALVRGGFPPEWLITVRRWTLGGWAILTIGIFLGGKWAYVELGWAGYWAWDPVENSSFMPWLATSASLHTLLILDKTNRLPRLAVFLGILAFSLTFLGTFITRSGIISSVHSFAESDIGPAYLAFITVLILSALTLITMRGTLLQGAAKANTWAVSKESGLLFTIFFLLFLLALVLTGTLLPLIVEAVRGVKISVQQPFFNAFAPWIAVGLVSLVGVGNLMRWKNGKIDDAVPQILFPALWSLVITTVLSIHKGLDIKSTLGFYLIIWNACILILDLVYKLKTLRWNGKLFLKFNRPYFGAWIVHMGFLLAITGFLGAYRGVEAQTTLKLGETVEFYGYTLKNEGLGMREGDNVKLVHANIKAVDGAGNLSMVEPTRSKYTNKDEWLNEIGIHSTFWHDLYLVLASFDSKTQEVVLKMHINPTVKLVWTSLVVMVIGALVGLTHRVLRRSIEVDSNGLELETMTVSVENLVSQLWEEGRRLPGYATTVAILAFSISLTLFGLSGSAFAQLPFVSTPAASDNAPKPGAKKPAALQLNPKLVEIGSELRCPTCQGLSILESETPQSTAMKAEIERQLAQGASKPEILNFFKVRYGEWILRQPDKNSTLGLLIWLVPIAGLILGPSALVMGLRKSRAREQTERDEVAALIKGFLSEQSLKSTGVKS